MSSNKSEELKKFLIATRKKVGAGLTNAPVWVLQKAGKRIWNPKQKRQWRNAEFGRKFRKERKKEGKE